MIFSSLLFSRILSSYSLCILVNSFERWYATVRNEPVPFQIEGGRDKRTVAESAYSHLWIVLECTRRLAYTERQESELRSCPFSHIGGAVLDKYISIWFKVLQLNCSRTAELILHTIVGNRTETEKLSISTSMSTRNKVMGILLIGFGLYITSSLLTFSSKGDIPEARLGSEGLSFWCTHPFGFPIRDDHRGLGLDMNCFPDRSIISAQLLNFGAWMAVAILSSFLYHRYKKIRSTNLWIGKLKVWSILLLYIGSLVLIYFLAQLIFFAVPPLLSQSDNVQHVLIQPR